MSLPLRISFEMRLDELSEMVGGKIQGDPKTVIHGICLDTRVLEKGDLFIAIVDVRDGHDFISQAIERGAAAVLASRPMKISIPVVEVLDTLEALHDLACDYRSQWGNIVVAISGSNGKTTSKEMIAGILSSTFNTFKAPGTWNNHLGVPLSLLSVKEENEVCVLEMGMNHAGELTRLAKIALPNIALLTNVGPVHLEQLGSIEAIARAKGELFEALDPEDMIVVNLDDGRIREVASKLSLSRVTFSKKEKANVQLKTFRPLNENETELEVIYGDQERCLKIPFLGEHNVSNLLGALGVAYALDIPGESLQDGIDSIVKPNLRFQKCKLKNGAALILDCYNANPVSMEAGLRTLAKLESKEFFIVLGDMMELGDEAARAHRDAGRLVGELGFDRLFLLGQFSRDTAQGAIQSGFNQDKIFIGRTHEEIAKELEKFLSAHSMIYFKGSRVMKLEKVADILFASLGRSVG